MTKNLMGKARDKDQPYMIFENGLIEHRVTKGYQNPENERKNNCARWMTWSRSAGTHGGWDAGDTYIMDVMRGTRLTYIDPILVEAGYTPTMPEGEHPMDAWR